MNLKSSILMVMTLATFSLTACGRPAQAPSSASQADSADRPGAECGNLISMDHKGLSPILDDSKIPSGKMVLTSLRTQMLIETTSESISIDASSVDGFKPTLNCNGLRTSSAESENRLTASFAVGDWFDSGDKRKSEQQRRIQAKFLNGTVESLTTEVIPDETAADSSSVLGQLTLDRIKIGKDTHFTFRVYAPTPSSVEVRFKIEYPADASGKRPIQLAIAVYERAK